jgi:hypothetical protein
MRYLHEICGLAYAGIKERRAEFLYRRVASLLATTILSEPSGLWRLLIHTGFANRASTAAK